MRILVVETSSVVDGYKQLKELTDAGHEPLEFSPHSEGVRILMKQNGMVPASAKSLELSDTIVKAYLGLGGTKTLNCVLVIENSSLISLLDQVQQIEIAGASVHEVRSFRSNPKQNYAILSHNDNAQVEALVKGLNSVSFADNHPVIQKFFGFNN